MFVKSFSMTSTSHICGLCVKEVAGVGSFSKAGLGSLADNPELQYLLFLCVILYIELKLSLTGACTFKKS